MKKSFTFIIGLVSIFIFGQDGAPATPYYDGFNWTLSGATLRDALADKITTTHTNFLVYTPGVWEALRVTDVNPSNPDNVLLIYGWENGSDGDVTNDRQRDKFNNGGDNGQWNREHVFPQALGNPSLGNSGPGADAHMLRSCDVQRNNTRGNRLFASGSGTQSYSISTNGWYPGDEWRGDMARIIMYMYLRYGSQCLPIYTATGTINSVDANMVNLLLDWNAADPVSQYEDNRNIYHNNTTNDYAQGNRNPFIDNPYLATVIWGGPAAQNRWPTIFLSSEDFVLNNVAVFPNPSKNGEFSITTTAELKNIAIYNVNGQLVQEIKNPNAIETSTYKVNNLATGFYMLQLQTENASVTKKVIVN